MSSMHVTFGGANGGGVPVLARRPRIAETVTTSGSSASSTAAAEDSDFARVTAVDAALYVAAGSSVSAATGYYVPSGTSVDIGPLQLGDVISGIEA